VITVLALGSGTLFNLPLPAQRALSFLPGNWDIAAVSDAKASIDWRVEMWQIVMKEDRWIANKVFGDGFGFTRRELAMMAATKQMGGGFIGGAEQEGFMITGAFHHGPLSTIRYVGIVGLILYYALIFLLAFRAVKLIRASLGTDLLPTALFVGMPTLYYAITFPFGGGQFDVDVPQYIYTAGLIKLVGRAAANVNAPHAEDGSLADYQPLRPGALAGEAVGTR
jgi:hypothetical protein